MQVSLTTLHNLEEYRLGFSAAIIHDLFNWCTVIYIIYTLYLHLISTHYIYNIYTLYLQYLQVHNPRPAAYRDRDWVLREAYR